MQPYHRTRYFLLVLSVLFLIHTAPPTQGASPLSAYNPASRATTAQAATTSTDPSLDFVGALGSIVETAAVSGSLAYVGEYNSLAILDVSDPAQLALLSRVPLSGQIKGIKVVGNLVYIANYFYSHPIGAVNRIRRKTKDERRMGCALSFVLRPSSERLVYKSNRTAIWATDRRRKRPAQAGAAWQYCARRQPLRCRCGG
jgi:hypothetical protein